MNKFNNNINSFINIIYKINYIFIFKKVSNKIISFIIILLFEVIILFNILLSLIFNIYSITLKYIVLFL